MTNQSRLDLNVQLYVDHPFYLTADKKKAVSKRKIVLMSGTTVTIPMNFLPHVNLDNPCSRNYNAALCFEYNEHPNKVRAVRFALQKSRVDLHGANSFVHFQDRIPCKGTVNFPTITLPCNNVIINCILGSTAVKKFQMTNNGPVHVIYKFLWAGESIETHRIARDIRVSYLDVSVHTRMFSR